ncbi:MAG: T9SS type A sorting domain-containing protein, partial [Ignavibacteria bacterium]
EIPTSPELFQNFPNPFNPVTKIKFSIPTASFVSLKVYDALGRNISNLLNENMNPGVYFSPFNGSDLNSGVYFYTLETKDLNSGRIYKEAKKMLIVK